MIECFSTISIVSNALLKQSSLLNSITTFHFLTSLVYFTKDFSGPLCFSENKLSKVFIGDILAIIGNDMDVNV